MIRKLIAVPIFTLVCVILHDRIALKHLGNITAADSGMSNFKIGHATAAAVASGLPSQIEGSLPTNLADHLTSHALKESLSTLFLAEDQKAGAEKYVERYFAAIETIDTTLGIAMKDAMRNVLSVRQGDDPAASAIAYLAFVQTRRKVEIASREQEQILFRGVQPLLRPEQEPVWQRFVWRRERDWGYVRNVSLIRGSWIDLSRLIEPFLRNKPLTPEMDAILLLYEQQVTPHFAALNAVYYEGIENELIVVSQRVVREVDGQSHHIALPDESQQMEAGWSRARRPLERIAELNDQFCDRLVAVLPPDQGLALRHAYRQKAYPDVWPDHRYLGPVLQAATDIEGAPDNILSALVALRDQYLQRHEQITRDMMKCRRDRELKHRIRDGGSPVVMEAYAKAMNSMNAKRVKLNEDTLRTLDQLLAGQSSPEFAEVMSSYRERLELTKTWPYHPLL